MGGSNSSSDTGFVSLDPLPILSVLTCKMRGTFPLPVPVKFTPGSCICEGPGNGQCLQLICYYQGLPLTLITRSCPLPGQPKSLLSPQVPLECWPLLFPLFSEEDALTHSSTEGWPWCWWLPSPPPPQCGNLHIPKVWLRFSLAELDSNPSASN